MDGKKYFMECCQSLGLDCDKFIKLAQQKKDRNHFKCKVAGHHRKPTQMYVVNFDEEYGVFIAWNVLNDLINSVFKLKIEDTLSLRDNEIMKVKKYDQFSGWGEEIVYVFRPEKAKDFIREYVIKQVKEDM